MEDCSTSEDFNPVQSLWQCWFMSYLTPMTACFVTHSLEEIQLIASMFPWVSEWFCLTINIKKTDVMYQPAPDKRELHQSPCLFQHHSSKASREFLLSRNDFFSDSVTVDDEVTQRITRASRSIGMLTRNLWGEHGVTLRTNINVYVAEVLNTHLYTFKTWTVYRPLIKLLEQF